MNIFPSFGDVRCKMLEIGDWDMDLNAIKTVVHGIDTSKFELVGCAAFVHPDSGSGSAVYPLDYLNTSISNTPAGDYHVEPSSVALSRTTGGHFDGTAFNQTGWNRGWVFVYYRPL